MSNGSPRRRRPARLGRRHRCGIIHLMQNWTPIGRSCRPRRLAADPAQYSGLLKNALHILLEGAPDNARSTTTSLAGVESTVSVERTNRPHLVILRAHLNYLQVKPVTARTSPATVRQVAEGLKEKFKIEHPTVGIDSGRRTAIAAPSRQSVISLHAGHAH